MKLKKIAFLLIFVCVSSIVMPVISCAEPLGAMQHFEICTPLKDGGFKKETTTTVIPSESGAKMGVAAGAAAGAAIGSIVPVIGTTAGAAVGAIVGGIAGWIWGPAD